MKNSIVLLVAAAASAGLFCGCQSAPAEPTASQKAMVEELRAINKNLKELTQKIEEYPAALALASSNQNGRVSKGANQLLLAKIKPLPEKPTDEQIRTYIEAIQQASVGQNSFSSSDPQVALYGKIGPGHLNLILPLLDSNNHYLRYALPQLIAESDKQKVLEILPYTPKLLDTVVQKGWIMDARPGIFKLIETTDNLWALQNVIGQLCLDPKDREKVADLYVRRSGMHFALPTLRTYPEIDAGKLANKAWEKQRISVNNNDWNLRKVALQAAESGNIDALGFLITKLSQHSGGDQDMASAVSMLTGKPVGELPAWFAANRDNLVFDAKAQRYTIKPAVK